MNTIIVYMQTATQAAWVTKSQAPTSDDSATALIGEPRTTLGLYGTLMELATDGRQQFASYITQHFLHNCGVTGSVSSTWYPQSSGRAELAVKTAKRQLGENISPSGDLNTNSTARALLRYRNIPVQYLGASPAHLLYDRQPRDHLPSFAHTLKIRPE